MVRVVMMDAELDGIIWVLTDEQMCGRMDV